MENHRGNTSLNSLMDGFEHGILKVEAEITKPKWEKIDGFTQKMAVPGGWLISRHNSLNGNETMVFVADPEHKWLSLKDREHMLATKNRLLKEQVQELKDKLALAEAELAGKKRN